MKYNQFPCSESPYNEFEEFIKFHLAFLFPLFPKYQSYGYGNHIFKLEIVTACESWTIGCQAKRDLNTTQCSKLHPQIELYLAAHKQNMTNIIDFRYKLWPNDMKYLICHKYYFVATSKSVITLLLCVWVCVCVFPFKLLIWSYQKILS